MGYIYRKKRTRPDGSIYTERIYQIKFYRNGQVYRESTGTDEYDRAKTLLKLREGAIAEGKPVPKDKRFSEMLEAVKQNYTENGRKSSNSLERRIKKHIEPFLAHRKASDITPDLLRLYRKKRAIEGASPATINRELAVISKAYTISDFGYRPRIEKLKETNVRKGFVTRQQLETIKIYLPPEIAQLVEFLFLTGWRRGEAFQLRWKDVDFASGFVSIEAFATKNDEPRLFPLYSDLASLLTSRRQETDLLERQKSCIIPWVFHRNGLQIRDFRGAWAIACQKAKLSGTLVHDLRRSAIKVFTERGISEQIGMKLAGHKTASVYRRYNIITAEDLRKNAEKLETGTAMGTISGTNQEKAKVASGISD